ncbi:MAG: tyrosine--tRNA ligase [Coriobacteriia bacterium]|nr:tyrosine--tRNA ligase [Coriobacteriia bacterium]
MINPQEQLHIIESGTADIVPHDALLAKLEEDRPLRIKLGVDPTAPDLHLGHAVPLRKLRQFQDLGHTVVLIIGDFTALIGDPSGRNTTRPPLSIDEIEANAQTYMEQAFHILDPDQTEVHRNSEWLGKLTFADTIQLTSKFTLARTIERDDFSKRLKAGEEISQHELLYPLMQAYDSIMIEADVEIGGTDQLFNLLAGRELAKKMGRPEQVCLTLPLLEGTDGVKKMSKSYGNYIGLTDTSTDMFGKVMSIPDTLIVKYYRLCTLLPVDEVDAIERGLADGSLHPNEAKRRLGREIVTLYHDEAAAREAEAAFDRQFKEHAAPDDMPEYTVNFVTGKVTPDPNPDYDMPGLDGGYVYLAALMTKLALTPSANEARKLIDGGGVKVGGAKLEPKQFRMHPNTLTGAVLQVGKRKFARILATTP